jgi:signal transduction histidine kinase
MTMVPKPTVRRESLPSTTTGAPAPARILVVDDRPENLLAIRAVLAASDYHLVEASSGAEALKKLIHEEDFALVLLDVRMPGIDGFEVANLMRHRERTRAVPIVFLTAEAADVQSAYHGYEAGAVDYLVKPLDPLVLRAKVAAFVELHQQRQLIRQQGEMLLAAQEQRHALEIAEVELESRRRETETLEEAVRMRDEFLALASHELNTPLSPLLMSIQLLLRGARTGRCDPRSAIRTLEVAQRQIERLTRLVAELLQITRIESGQLALSIQDVDLADVVRQTIDAHAAEAQHEGTTVRLDGNAQARGRWDRSRLEQIVTNLITNAIKFSNHEPVEVSIEQDEQRTRLFIRDHGVGIGDDQLEKIFERYGRAESAQHYGGLGLGLYIARKLAEAHGGTIRVESVLGEGSTFTVDLPTLAAAATDSRNEERSSDSAAQSSA